MRKIILSVIFLMVAFPLYAEGAVIFTGNPEIKISEGGVARLPQNLNKEKASNFKCTITKVDDKYYWASRDNIELIPFSSGAFITYWAVNGSGYVRIVKPEMKKEIKFGAVAGDPEEKFDYVEHLLLGLKSITYYGQMK
ncbi:MAG: hypothetical protein C0402_14775 [Thermodesulfovibrio sp.]|nr:hypothetical protein [Thermodesulfovibrio sp.]